MSPIQVQSGITAQALTWPRAWYPLIGSGALAAGRVCQVQAFGRNLAVFRDHTGAVGILDARCGHFGADLSRGTVTAEGLRCPLHGRCFARDGGCPGHAPQRSWPAAEAYGLVFTFLGDGPRPPLPQPDGFGIDLALMTKPSVTTGPVELGFIGANAFDAGHLAPVHGRELVGEPVITALAGDGLRISFTARIAGRGWRDRLLRRIGLSQVQIDTDCWGGNLLFFHHRRVGCWTLHGAVPVDVGSTRVFTVSGIGGTGWRDRIRLALHHRAVTAFVAEDDRALEGARSGSENLDPVADRALLAWLAHVRSLPRVAP